ncbi:hypothetical protein ACHAXS_013448 [Conticribra weissflogii]
MAERRHNHSKRGVKSDPTANEVQNIRNPGDDDDRGSGESERNHDYHHHETGDVDIDQSNNASGDESGSDDNDEGRYGDSALKQLLRRLRREHLTNFGKGNKHRIPDERKVRYLIEAAAGNVALASALYWEDYLAEYHRGDKENNERRRRLGLRYEKDSLGAGGSDGESGIDDGDINLKASSASLAKATKTQGKLKGDEDDSTSNKGEDDEDAKQPAKNKTKKSSSSSPSSSSSSSSSSFTSPGGRDEDSQKPSFKNAARNAMASSSVQGNGFDSNRANNNNDKNSNMNQDYVQQQRLQQQANLEADVSALLSALSDISSNNNSGVNHHMQNNISNERARILAEFLLSGANAGSTSNNDYNTLINALLSQLAGTRERSAGVDGNRYLSNDVVSAILASLNINSNANAAAAASGQGNGNGNSLSHSGGGGRASTHYAPADASAAENNSAYIWRPHPPAVNNAAAAAAGAYAEQQHMLQQLQQQFYDSFGGGDNSSASNEYNAHAAGGNENPAAAATAAGGNTHGNHDASAATAMEAAMQLRFNYAMQQQQQQQQLQHQVQFSNQWHQASTDRFENLARAYAFHGKHLTEEEGNIIMAALAQGANIRQRGELDTDAATAAGDDGRMRSNAEEGNQNQGSRALNQPAANNNENDFSNNSAGNSGDQPANDRNELNLPQQQVRRGEASQQRMRRIQHGMVRQHNMDYRESDSDSMGDAGRDGDFDDVARRAGLELAHHRALLNHDALWSGNRMRGGAAEGAAARRDDAGEGGHNHDPNAQVAGDSASISEDEGGLLSMVRRGSSFLENGDNQDESRKRARLDDHHKLTRKFLGDDNSDDGSDSLDGDESVDLKDFLSDEDEEMDEKNESPIPSNSRGKASRVIWGLSTNDNRDDDDDEESTTSVCIPKSWLRSGFSLSDCGNGLKVSDPEDDDWDQISRSHPTFLRDSPLKGIKGLFPFNCKGVSAMLSLVTAMLYAGVTVQGSLVHCKSDRTPFDELTKAQRKQEFETRLVDALTALILIAAQSSAKRCADALVKMDQRMARRRTKHFLSAEEEDAYLKKRNSLLKRCHLCRVCWWEIDTASNNVTIFPKNRDPKDILLMRSYTNILDIKCYVRTHLRSFTEPGGCALLLETLIHCHGRRHIEKLLSTLDDSRPAKKVDHLCECSCKRALGFLERRNNYSEIENMPDEHDCIPPELLSLIITGQMHSDLESWSADMLGIGFLHTDNKIRVGKSLLRPVKPVWICHGDIGYSVLFLEKKDFLGSEKALDEDCGTFRLAHWNCWSGERSSMKVITSMYNHRPYSHHPRMGIISNDSDRNEMKSKKSPFGFNQEAKASWEQKGSPALDPITDEELQAVKPHPEDVKFYRKQFRRWRFSFGSPQDNNLEANADVWIPFYRLHGRNRLVVEMKLSPRICVLVRSRWPMAVVSDFVPEQQVPLV